MAKEPLTITIAPDSELARVLANTDEPVVLNSNGLRYSVEREDTFANYDPQRSMTALRESPGALTGVDTKQLLADLDEQREQDGLGRPVQ